MAYSVPDILSNRFETIIDKARLAPSVHNLQPWKVKYDGNTILIKSDKRQRLKYGDPIGRESIISLGIFAEAVSLMASTFGLQAKQFSFDGKDEACITLSYTNSLKGSSLPASDLLNSRATDRSIYSPVTLNLKQKATIKESWNRQGATIHLITDRDKIDLISNLTAKGIGVALANPEFRKELSSLLVEPWSKAQRGISVKSLYISGLLAWLEPQLMRAGMGINREVMLELNRWMSSSGIICITTPGDMPKYWFTAGRAYMAVALNIEALGLSQATSAATVEASTFHEDIEEILNTRERLQSTIRIGMGVSKRFHSPRVSTKDLIIT